MKRMDVKQMMICVLALLAPRFHVAEAYPLVPAVFAAGFLSGMNRNLLFLCAAGGLAVLSPLRILVKYGLILILILCFIKAMEWFTGRCRVPLGAVFAGAVTAAVTIALKAGHFYEPERMLTGLLEGAAIAGLSCAGARICCFVKEELPAVAEPLPVYIQGGERLGEYAKAFGQLARTFYGVERRRSGFTQDELGRMHNEITGGLCLSCSRCSHCWEHANASVYPALFRFLQAVVRREHVDEAKQELSRYCTNMDKMMYQVSAVFERARLNMAWYNRLQENRDIIAQQLDAMAYIMRDCAQDEQDVTSMERRFVSAIQYQIQEMGVQAESLRVLKNTAGKHKILLRGRTVTGRCIPVREIAGRISRCGGGCYEPAKDSRSLLGERGAVLSFQETNRYTVHYGVAHAVREAEQVSGDSFSFLLTESGKCILCLSDGMGSGYLACKESELVIDLIEKFMEAGFQPETALQMMNAAMVTHGEDRLFSTVDLVSIDLDSAKAGFYKIGAPATYVRRGDEVCRISDNSMPVGVFVSQKPAVREADLKSGDYIVMVTDGVFEFPDEEDAEQKVAEIIRSVDIINPTLYADAVLNEILQYTGGQVRDDMTVLTAGLWES